MASINKLSIRGIRSFSHEREQVLFRTLSDSAIDQAIVCWKSRMSVSITLIFPRYCYGHGLRFEGNKLVQSRGCGWVP